MLAGVTAYHTLISCEECELHLLMRMRKAKAAPSIEQMSNVLAPISITDCLTSLSAPKRALYLVVLITSILCALLSSTCPSGSIPFPSAIIQRSHIHLGLEEHFSSCFRGYFCLSLLSIHCRLVASTAKLSSTVQN